MMDVVARLGWIWLVAVPATAAVALVLAAWRLARPSVSAEAEHRRTLLAYTLSLVVLGLMLAQGVAIVDAYVQTQVVNESTWSYFQHLSTARLLGTSHSHLFGYTITYGVLALLFSMTGASARVRMLVIAALLLTGPFDVLSWWAQKLWSPRFDWLTLATGAVAGTASLVAAVRVWRDALLAKRSPPTA